MTPALSDMAHTLHFGHIICTHLTHTLEPHPLASEQVHMHLGTSLVWTDACTPFSATPAAFLPAAASTDAAGPYCHYLYACSFVHTSPC
mmetsp:Transcript_10201/g.25434  ORF Transcript_10201/g.25434 Transcript_10201/m.25434 type:complete len:89 (-) Transcript_10201:1260-1526(-)